MSDKDCPVPEPFSGAIGSRTYGGTYGGTVMILCISSNNNRDMHLFMTVPISISHSGIVLAGGIIIIGSDLPFFLVLIEKMDDGC